MWAYLRKRSFCGLKFRRQHGVSRYILDFYCPALRLAIEVDGGQHYSEHSQQHDFEREQFLASLSITVVRFTNAEIMNMIDDVLFRLGRVVESLSGAG
jgi:very-short-patch-repair endonuclease